VSAPDESFVFNIVWNGTVFTYLRYFVASQIAQSGAQFRFIVNACPPEQVALMEEFAARHADRVLELVTASDGKMVGHGDALDVVRTSRDDGEYFCFIDPDILARAPFVARFSALLDGTFDAVTSGRGVWCETDVIPEGHLGVNGEYFYARDGYLFGSPHFAMYRRAPLDDTLERWGVRFGSGGPELDDAAKARLVEIDRNFLAYDTAKIVNIFFQEDGHRLGHVESDDILHVGAMSHYLSPPEWGTYVVLEEGGDPEPHWATWGGQELRFGVARYCARVLQSLVEGTPAPEMPSGLEPSVQERLLMVRSSLVDLVHTYESTVNAAP
jgi:hypothetical protein